VYLYIVYKEVNCVGRSEIEIKISERNQAIKKKSLALGKAYLTRRGKWQVENTRECKTSLSMQQTR